MKTFNCLLFLALISPLAHGQNPTTLRFVRMMQTELRDPDSMRIDVLVETKEGNVCMIFSGKNAFGGYGNPITSAYYAGEERIITVNFEPYDHSVSTKVNGERIRAESKQFEDFKTLCSPEKIVSGKMLEPKKIINTLTASK
jgi:hypothetical protein